MSSLQSTRPILFEGRRGARELISRYEAILLDSYGVLVDAAGPLPAGRALLDVIADSGRPFFVVTNDASRLPESSARRFRGFDMAIDAGQIITSGSLLTAYFAANDLAGAGCIVMGPPDSEAYVRAAGGQIAPIAADTDCDAVVACDEAGYSYLAALDDVLSALYRQFDRGRSVALVQPNPDLIYPKQGGSYGFTAGAITMVLEAGLARRYPKRGLAFAKLGKPHAPMFDDARRRAGTDSLLMIGDQLETDIAGALAAGIDAALITTGVSRWDEADGDTVSPTYIVTL